MSQEGRERRARQRVPSSTTALCLDEGSALRPPSSSLIDEGGARGPPRAPSSTRGALRGPPEAPPSTTADRVRRGRPQTLWRCRSDECEAASDPLFVGRIRVGRPSTVARTDELEVKTRRLRTPSPAHLVPSFAKQPRRFGARTTEEPTMAPKRTRPGRACGAASPPARGEPAAVPPDPRATTQMEGSGSSPASTWRASSPAALA